MNNMNLEKNATTPYYPKVSFEADSGICEIAGESYMEEAYKFYLPLINWIKQYTREEKRRIILVIKLMYFNTSTSKCLLDIFEVLKQYKDAGGKVEITWYYDSEDPDMIEEIKDFEREAELQFKIRKLEA